MGATTAVGSRVCAGVRGTQVGGRRGASRGAGDGRAGEGGKGQAAMQKELEVRQHVVGHVVEGLRGELVRELVGMMGV